MAEPKTKEHRVSLTAGALEVVATTLTAKYVNVDEVAKLKKKLEKNGWDLRKLAKAAEPLVEEAERQKVERAES